MLVIMIMFLQKEPNKEQLDFNVLSYLKTLHLYHFVLQLHI